MKKQDGSVGDLLVHEMLASMPHIRGTVMNGGWFRRIDLVSSLIVTILGCLLLTSFLVRPNQNPLTGEPVQQIPQTSPLQPLEEQVTAQEDTGQPGDQNQAGNEQPGEGGPTGGSTDGSQPGEDPGSAASADLGTVAETLQELGSDLSRQAGTYDLGQALENLEMEQAADSLEELAGQIDDLSPESLENLAESMENAADSLEQAGDPSLSENLDDAASAISEGSGESAPDDSASDALGQVANDLRDLAGDMAAFSGANSGAGQGSIPQTGSPEPLSRFTDEGGDFELPQEVSPESGLLSPAPPDAQGDGTASGSYNSTTQQPNEPNQNPLLPNALLWKWRDVVSQYFQR